MVFKRLLGSLGVGGPTVDTVLDAAPGSGSAAVPGGALTGRVHLKGGGSDPYGSGVAYVFVPTEFEAQARLLVEDVSDETT